MTDENEIIESAVSLVATRDVKPSLAPDFEGLVKEASGAARAFDENLRVTVIRHSGSGRNRYVIVFFFSDDERLEAWEGSAARGEILKKMKKMEVGRPTFREVTGLEFWFSLPDTAAVSPPPRYKMLVVTFIAFYALSLVYNYLLHRPLFASLPFPVSNLIRVIILVVIMTYLLMPLLTRLFARWLYPLKA